LEFLLSLLILILVAKVFGELLHFLGYSSMIGEVFAGILLGPSLLGLVTASDSIRGVAELGLVVLMLVTGLNSRFEIMTRMRLKAFAIALSGVVVSLLLTFLTLRSMGYGLLLSFFVAATFSNTATELTARFTSGHHLRQIIVGASLMDDVLAVYILGILSASARSGVLDLMSFLWTTVGIVAFFLAVGMLSRFFIIKHNIAKRLWKYEYRGFPLAFSLSLALALAVIAQNIGLHAIIGAYMAGIFIGRLRERPMVTLQSRIMYNKILDDLSTSMQSILTPIFFAYVGLILAPNWGQLNLLLLPTLLAVVFAGKIIGCGGAAGLAGMKRRDSLAIGAAMCARGSLELAILNFGFISLGAHGFTSELFATFVVVTLATTFMAPIFFKLVSKAY
jgi:Kef-type K+ transport system membrane component KefB